jgi:hypothetical protein
MRAALTIRETAWVIISRFLFIRPVKPPPRHMDVLFMGGIVPQNGRDGDGSARGCKCLYFDRIRRLQQWSDSCLTSTPGTA